MPICAISPARYQCRRILGGSPQSLVGPIPMGNLAVAKLQRTGVIRAGAQARAMALLALLVLMLPAGALAAGPRNVSVPTPLPLQFPPSAAIAPPPGTG